MEQSQSQSLVQKQYDIFKHLEHSQSQKHEIAVVSLNDSPAKESPLSYQEQEMSSVQNSPGHQTPKTEVCSINVIARVRPQIPNEQGHPVCIEVVDDSVINGNKTQIIVRIGVHANKQVEQKVYSFEKVLDPESTQQNVFAQVEGDSLCSAFLNGQNCTVFVYGPTSTGKTFTMQGNADDIIHGKETANLKSFNEDDTLNGSQDQSQTIQIDEQSFSTEAKVKGYGGTKRISLNLTRREKEPNSLQQRRLSNCSYSIETPRSATATKPSITKISRDMIEENRHKGIIQRVIDTIYQKFSQRQDLKQNCEIKISFLEIYKENVTDLLEVHNAKQQSYQQLTKMKMQKNQSTSLITSRRLETPDKHSEVSTNRGKSKTFYGMKDFDDSMYSQRQKMESGNRSPYIQHEQERLLKDQKSQNNRDILRTDQKQRYEVRENAIKGVYVQNLSEIVCKTAEQAYNCLLEGLMRKKMSQTARNTSSSRSHTIFQIKMYMKQESVDNLLLPQYVQEKKTESKIVSKFCLIDLAGSERMTEADTNSELIDEARFINKSLSALGNVVAALRTLSKKANLSHNGQSINSQRRSSSFHNSRISINTLGGDQRRRSSFYTDKRQSVENVVTHVPFRDSKLTHILKDCLGSNSFTHLIICLSPSYLCLAESISTLAFTKNAKAVRQNIVENHQFKSDMAQRKLNIQKDKDRIAQPVSSRQQSGAMYLLNKMSSDGNDQEEVMLRSFLSELGYSQFSDMSIKQLFSLTLQQVKKLTDEHHDMNKQIEEMKNAMDKDLSNPKTLELITNARSESIDDKSNQNNITGLSDIPFQEVTPRSVQNLSIPKIDSKQKNNSPPKLNLQPIQVRNSNLNSLNSIQEESVMTINSPTLSNNVKKRKLSIKIDLAGITPKQGHSSTSVLTFGGKLDPLKVIQSEEDYELEKDIDEILNQKSDQQLYASNSDGKRLSEQNSESYQVTETEVSDIIDETTIFGQQQQITAQRTIISKQNLMKLKQKFQNKTMLAIISTHLKAIIKKRVQQSKYAQAQQRSSLTPNSNHYRQRSSDAAASATLWQCTRQTSNQSVTKRVAEVQSDIKKLLQSQSSITPDREFEAQKNYAFSYQMRGGNQNDNSSQRFMPKLAKSSSCPIQLLDENQKEIAVQEEQKTMKQISAIKMTKKNSQQNFFNHQNVNKVKEIDQNMYIQNTDICSSDDSDEGYQDIGINFDNQKESENGSVSANMRDYNSTPKRQSDRFKFATPIVHSKKPKPYQQYSKGSSHQSQSSSLHKNYKYNSLDKNASKTTSNHLIQDYAGANLSQISGSNHHSKGQSKLIKESPSKNIKKQSLIRVIQLNSPKKQDKQYNKGGIKDFKSHIIDQNKQVAEAKSQQQHDILAFQDVYDNRADHDSNFFQRIQKSQNFMLSSSSAAGKYKEYSDKSNRNASDEKNKKQQIGSNRLIFPRPSNSSSIQQNDEIQLHINDSENKQHQHKTPLHKTDQLSSQQGKGYGSPSQVSHQRETLNSKMTPGSSLRSMMVDSTFNTQTPYQSNSQEKLSEFGTIKGKFNKHDPRLLKAKSLQKGGTDNKYLQSHRVRSSLYIGIPNLQSPQKLLSPTLSKTQTKDDRKNYSNNNQNNHSNLTGLSKLLSPSKPQAQQINEDPYRNNGNRQIIQQNQNSNRNSKHVSRPNKQGASGYKISKPMAGSKLDPSNDL